MAYAVRSAIDSGIFDSVIVSTDPEAYADVARHYGAEVPFLRPTELAGDKSPDIQWIEHLLSSLKDDGRAPDCFAILRPTSPFRQADTIQRAWSQFQATEGIDLACSRTLWTASGQNVVDQRPSDVADPAICAGRHAVALDQYAALPEIYVQNASLEIARSRVVLDGGSIAATSSPCS